MLLDADRCYRALRTHDTRFDGRFFVGVSSTRIYCRPVCTAKAPRPEHCRFFATAAAAEAGGFRPCLRCRPELAPGNASVDAAHGLAVRAASLIEDGLLGDGGRLDELARRLGVTDRHLRRVFQTEFGVSPIEFAQTHRLLLAKRLLTDTRLPVVDVALGSGFASLRRFNALFKTRYRLAPSDLRKRAAPAAAREGFRFWLRYQPPFDWPSLLRFLAQRAIDGVEQADDERYRRTVRLEHHGRVHEGWIEVAWAPRRSAIELMLQPGLARVLPQVVGRVKRLFDVACPAREIEAALGSLAEGRAGLRVPGAFDGFEASVRAILGQQVTVKAARTLAARFARAFGQASAGTPVGLERFFPSASAVAAVPPADIGRLGIVSVRARAIVTLAREVAEGGLALEPGADVAETIRRLRAIPGIGEWTAQYIAMRALSWPDAFPDGDVGIMRALGERHPARVRQHAEAWRPWRAYAVMHLWHSTSPKRSTMSHQPAAGD
jgi:AraC family transcriptional regulator of adaptative response / DNA-3-methyladenine glycosylase II